MSFLSRRDLINQAAAYSLLASRKLLSQAGVAGPHEDPDAPTLFGFVDQLPIPKLLAPIERRKFRAVYHVRMKESLHGMHSSLPQAKIWGYEGLYPGPTIEAARGERVEIIWENSLPEDHLFKVDPHIHGGMPPTPAVRTVPHLHGARTTSESDGLPEKWFTPGKSVRYIYPNEQQAATLWYHDHAVGITRLNVYAGLSGLYLLRDGEEQSLSLPAGDYEIPLVVQDRTVDDKGQLVYAPMNDDGVPLAPGIWGPEFLGKCPVINGKICPYLNVEPRLYRLRVLNGANTRFFDLRFNLARRAADIPSLLMFSQIGSDGGLLPKPETKRSILLGPAERADLLVDFTGFEGKTVTLMNNAAAPYPGWASMGMHAPRLEELMQFRVVLDRKAVKAVSKTVKVGAPTPFIRYSEKDAVKSRDFLLVEQMDQQGRSLGVRINEKGYDDPVSEVVKLGTLEKWRFINTTEDAHPMHLHLVQFQILHRQGFDYPQFTKGNIQPVGEERLPSPGESGWKDTAIVLPNEILSILVKFEGYTGRYVFHCHMLEHEDNDMMRPYLVIP
ncbi:MAG: multicopper oxidase family protein [Acidobacteria bacterium]|nr:multicopper oxidase family protein [Acidobacteriota bacterium]